jgi:serine/threonine-protein kinase
MVLNRSFIASNTSLETSSAMGRLLLCWLSLCWGMTALAQETVLLSDQAYEILKNRCSRCHGGESVSGDVNVLDRENLLRDRGTGSEQVYVVKPGDTGKSTLLQVMSGESAYMPLAGSAEAGAMTAEEKQVLRDWIAQGADFPKRRPAKFVSHTQVLQGIRDHLFQADPEDRPFLRFFTFEHLVNNETVTDRDLRLLKAGLSKLINSLCRERQIVLPQPVDGTEQAVFAVDLRKLGWDRNNLWLKLLKRYPYSLSFETAEDEEARRVATDLTRLANTPLGEANFIRADWFLAHASRPPLYHEFLDLPDSLQKLEEELGVNSQEAFRDGTLQRAAFTHSNVSYQNRLVERLTPRHSEYLWVSYDFRPSRARGDLVRFPLGPEFSGNPYSRYAFQHAGGEIIFSLPNGMQAYLLVQADGKRLDVPAPIDIVQDKSGVSGSPQVVNGLSCIHCHRVGMISGFRDEIRDSEVLGGAADLHVKRLYPPAFRMEELVQADKEHFLLALEKVTGPFLKQGDDVNKQITAFPEPIGHSVFRFQADLTARELALELGLPDAETLQNKIRDNRALLRMGLGTLLNGTQGRIKRQKLESLDGTSLYQDISAELRIGAPVQY